MQTGPYSRDFLRQRWPKRKLTTKIFHYLRFNERPIDFSKDQGRDLRKKAQKFVLEDGALFLIAWKMGSQPRRAATNTESLSLWQTCWSLRPWQDERKGLYLIQWCFSWTLKLWLQFSWSLLTFVFLFLFQVTSRYYWVRLLEDWNCKALRCLPAYFKEIGKACPAMPD